jgi:hypothetical protein
MSKTSEEDKGRWEQVMENFDLIFQQMNDIDLIQQDIKRDLNATKDDQRLIAKQVQANGQPVASLTLRTMKKEAIPDPFEDVSVVFEEEDNDL